MKWTKYLEWDPERFRYERIKRGEKSKKKKPSKKLVYKKGTSSEFVIYVNPTKNDMKNIYNNENTSYLRGIITKKNGGAIYFSNGNDVIHAGIIIALDNMMVEKINYHGGFDKHIYDYLTVDTIKGSNILERGESYTPAMIAIANNKEFNESHGEWYYDNHLGKEFYKKPELKKQLNEWKEIANKLGWKLRYMRI